MTILKIQRSLLAASILDENLSKCHIEIYSFYYSVLYNYFSALYGQNASSLKEYGKKFVTYPLFLA